MIKNILFFCAILNIGSGGYSKSSWNILNEPFWNTLRVTWGIPGITPKAFNALPLTERDALKAGFTKISQQCSGTFDGHRYLKGNDFAIILLYDVNGYIAGIQTAVPKKLVEPAKEHYIFDSSAVYQQDKIHGHDVYVLTVYFVNPDIICTQGRGASNVEKEGIGNDLYLRNGATVIKVSKKQDSAHIGNKWKKGGCFLSMGRHYWYNVQKNLPAEEFLPIFLLYNQGKLTGFGFVWFGRYTSSDRYEYPPKEAIKLFIDPVPKFLPKLYDAVGATTIHVFFNVNPLNLIC